MIESTSLKSRLASPHPVYKTSGRNVHQSIRPAPSKIEHLSSNVRSDSFRHNLPPSLATQFRKKAVRRIRDASERRPKSTPETGRRERFRFVAADIRLAKDNVIPQSLAIRCWN